MRYLYGYILAHVWRWNGAHVNDFRRSISCKFSSLGLLILNQSTAGSASLSEKKKSQFFLWDPNPKEHFGFFHEFGSTYSDIHTGFIKLRIKFESKLQDSEVFAGSDSESKKLLIRISTNLLFLGMSFIDQIPYIHPRTLLVYRIDVFRLEISVLGKSQCSTTACWWEIDDV
jgi:hypothetical protein